MQKTVLILLGCVVVGLGLAVFFRVLSGDKTASPEPPSVETTFSPQGSTAIVTPVIPLGVTLLDVAHELGDVEDPAVETLPLLWTAKDLSRIPVKQTGSPVEFLSREDTKRQKAGHQMIMIAHQTVSRRITAVAGQVLADGLQ